MRILSLNTWGSRLADELYEFVAQQKDSVDVFCFQEVFHDEGGQVKYEDKDEIDENSFHSLQQILTEYTGHFIPTGTNHEGLAAFVRNGVVYGYEQEYAFRAAEAEKEGGTEKLDRPVQCVQARDSMSIFNFHGLWTGRGKQDTPDRLMQSRNLRTFMERFEKPWVLCGDFNLLPDTESLAIAGEGMTNLIEEYSITSTRSSYYKKEVRFADYMFVSPELRVNDFQVLPDEVSDHLPLVVDIEV